MAVSRQGWLPRNRDMIEEWWKHVKLVVDYLGDLDNAHKLKWWAMHIVNLVIWTIFLKSIT